MNRQRTKDVSIVLTVLAIFALGFILALCTNCRQAEVVPLAANFTNPIDIEGSASASAPALTFQDDTDTGIWRSAANTLNIASGGTEMLEVDSSGFTISSGTALDVDGSADFDVTSFAVDASGSIDVTSTEAAADAIHLDANGTVTTGIDIDLGSVSGMTIDGGLLNIGGATAGVADGDNDVVIAAVLEVDGEIEADGAIDADSTSNFADTATFSKGSGTALDVSSGGELNNDGTLDQNGTSNFADTVTIAGGLLLPAEDVTEANVITAAECGKTFFLNAETEFQSTLPAISTISAGCSFQFIVKAAPASASYTVVTGNSLENILIGGINELEVDTNDDGPYIGDGDTITFVDSTAVVGDYVYMISDGTSWYLRGQANADGGITLTQAD